MAVYDVGNVLEHIVTHLMTPAVIDLFEMVEIEKRYAEWMAIANGYCECLSGQREKMATVVDAGKSSVRAFCCSRTSASCSRALAASMDCFARSSSDSILLRNVMFS